MLIKYLILDMNCTKGTGGVQVNYLNTNASTWDKWDKMITVTNSSWLMYEKGTYPQTVSNKFRKAARDLADLLQENRLLEKHNFYLYLTTLIFLKEHPRINLILLERTSVLVDMRANFTIRSFITPLEVQHQKFSVSSFHF